eukprot:gene11085-56350_t
MLLGASPVGWGGGGGVVVRRGDAARATGLTRMNACSSRSHACLVVNVTRTLPGAETGGEACVVRGKLTLVDLAGSERVAKTGSTGERLEEAKSINLSLTTLGNVVAALIDPKATHVPYRDSKLTRLLEDSLGGIGKTSVIITVGPDVAHAGESAASCRFGERAMRVKTVSRVRREEDWRGKALRLEQELELARDEAAQLRDELAAARRRQPAAQRPRCGTAPSPPRRANGGGGNAAWEEGRASLIREGF